MSSLRDIRRRIHSVENIKKITNTMERIAAARLRHAQVKAEQSRPYILKMKELLSKAAALAVSNPFFEQRKAKRIGLVVITGDKGLSGSYTANILIAADQFLQKYKHDQIELILIGRKAIEYYNRRKMKVRYQLTNGLEKSSIDDIKHLSNKLIHWFLHKEMDEIWFAYTHFINLLQRKVVLEKFLSLPKAEIVNKELKVPSSYILEPNIDEILNTLLPRYCLTRLQSALQEAYAAELAARIVAMQTATKNSEEVITELTLIRNKTRQSNITREMIEISSGAEGQK
jgi:F-type H+-transporting ATPase subunit gamma